MKRLLGYWETTCHFAHDFLYGTGNVVACAEILGEINQITFHHTLNLLFQRHPLLRALICPGKEGLSFELSALFTDIPIDHNFYETKQQLQEMIEQEMQEIFMPRKNLWRAKLLTQTTDSKKNFLLITSHHAIADALSLVSFVGEFLKCYTQLLSNAEYQLPVLPLQNNIEKLLVKTNSWQEYLIFQKEIEEVAIEPMPFQKFSTLGQRFNRNIYIEINSLQLASLAKACRQYDVTVNSLLNAVMLQTAALMQDATLSITLKTPVNLRKYCSSDLAKYFGCNVSMVRTTHENITRNDNLWQIAKQFQQQLKVRIPQLGFLPEAFDYREFEISELLILFSMHNVKKRKHFLDGFGISNIGKIPLAKNYGKLELKSFTFSTNRHAGDFALFANVVSLHNSLNITFTYTMPLLQETWAQQFVATYSRLLMHCFSAEKT